MSQQTVSQETLLKQQSLLKHTSERKLNGEGVTVVASSLPSSNVPESINVLYVDVHEPPEIAQMLRDEKGIFVEVKPLEVGDYVWSNIIVERKTVNDMYSSIVHKDKRIWRQVFNMKHCSDRPILIIERWDLHSLKSPAMEKTIRRALASIILLGVNVVTIPSQGKDVKPFVNQLSDLYYSSDKKTLSTRPLPEKCTTLKKSDITENILAMLPSWGIKTIQKCILEYGSISNLVEQSVDELLKKGVSKKQIYYLKLFFKDEDLTVKLGINVKEVPK